MAAKGVVNWRYNAIRHHAKPRRVADSPTKHRPQICVRFRVQEQAKPPAATEGSITEAECENHRGRDEWLVLERI
jgi:hypothetical protein